MIVSEQNAENSTASSYQVNRHRFTVADYNRMGEVGILTEDNRVELDSLFTTKHRHQ